MYNKSIIILFILIASACSPSTNGNSNKKLEIDFYGKSTSSLRKEQILITQNSTGAVYLKLWNSNFFFHFLGEVTETDSGFFFFPKKNLILEKCKNSKRNFMGVNINDETCFQKLGETKLLISNVNEIPIDTIVRINKSNQFWSFPNKKQLDVNLDTEFVEEFAFEKMSIDISTTMLCISCDSYLDKLEIEFTSERLILKNFYKGKPLLFEKHAASFGATGNN